MGNEAHFTDRGLTVVRDVLPPKFVSGEGYLRGAKRIGIISIIKPPPCRILFRFVRAGCAWYLPLHLELPSLLLP
jgi:hypothetical protein